MGTQTYICRKSLAQMESTLALVSAIWPNSTDTAPDLYLHNTGIQPSINHLQVGLQAKSLSELCSHFILSTEVDAG